MSFTPHWSIQLSLLPDEPDRLTWRWTTPEGEYFEETINLPQDLDIDFIRRFANSYLERVLLTKR